MVGGDSKWRCEPRNPYLRQLCRLMTVCSRDRLITWRALLNLWACGDVDDDGVAINAAFWDDHGDRAADDSIISRNPIFRPQQLNITPAAVLFLSTKEQVPPRSGINFCAELEVFFAGGVGGEDGLPDTDGLDGLTDGIGCLS